ncbi:MAG: PAS domain-containing protein [Candidatus Aminicenantaceae bacterium]
MKDKDKTKEQLLDEMAKLRQKNAELEASESEHKWAEQELRESQERYKSLTEASPVGIFHSDSQGDFLYVNERWVEIARLSPEEAYGKGWENALHPDDKKHILTEWYQSCQEKNRLNQNSVFSPLRESQCGYFANHPMRKM